MADLEEVDVERHPPGGDCSLSTPVLTRQAVDGRNPGSGDEGPDGQPKFATGLALGVRVRGSVATVGFFLPDLVFFKRVWFEVFAKPGNLVFSTAQEICKKAK